MNKLNELSKIIKVISQDGYDFFAYNLVNNLKRRLKCVKGINDITLKHLRDNLEFPILNILRTKIFTIDNFDIDFVSSMLFNKENVMQFLFEIMRKYRMDYDKFKLIVKLFYTLAKEFNIANVQQPSTLLFKCKWWDKMDKNNKISYKGFFSVQNYYEIFELLAKHDYVSLENVAEICKDFNLSIEICYLLLLRNTITSWKLSYDIIEEVTGGKILIIKNDETELFGRCLDIINCINDKAKIILELKSIYKNVSPFNDRFLRENNL